MKGTEAGRARLAAHDETVTRAMAEHTEFHDKNPVAEKNVDAAPAPRGFLERNGHQEQEEQPAARGARPPPQARVASDATPVRPMANEDAPWVDVPNGDQAPLTPRGARHAAADDDTAM